MNGNAELLNFTFQNAEMGTNTLKQLAEIVEEKEFKVHLEEQLKGYQDMEEKAKNLLNEHGNDEKGISTMDKIKTYLMINMKTLTDKSASNIAEMMIVGSTMGIIDATKRLNHYKGADNNIRNLLDDLLKFEEKNAEKLKKFL